MTGRQLTVISPGLMSTVQDLGRFGWRHLGVPVSGALDSYALQAGNYLVGNEGHRAGIEITMGMAEFEFNAPAVCAVTGADVIVRVDEEEVPCWQPFLLRAGQSVAVGRPRLGFRVYLAVDGGIDVPVVLGSRSTLLRGGFGGHEGRALRSGDALPLVGDGTGRDLSSRRWYSDLSGAVYSPNYLAQSFIRFVPGAQHHCFPDTALQAFTANPYRLSPASDRMGLRMEGPRVVPERADILSDPVPTGGIQSTGDGLVAVMLADGQTTGGYPKIGTVIKADLPVLAQKRPGDQVYFNLVQQQEGRRLLQLQVDLLDKVRLSTERGRQFLLSIDGQGFRVFVSDIGLG